MTTTTKKTPQLDQLIGSEVKEIELPFFYRCLLGGPSGSGKTQSAITLPKSKEKPLLLIDFDGRWETVRDEIEEGTVKLLELFDEDPDSPKGWNRAEDLRKELSARARKPDFPFSGIIEDSLSMMSRVAMNSALKTDKKRGLGGAPAKQHYIPQIAFLVKHINVMRTLPCHYILTCHFDIEKDEDDGKLKIQPKVTRSLRSEIPTWFNEVYRCYRNPGKEGKMLYFWETAGTGKYEFFKSTLNNKQRYWIDPIEIDFSKSPIGFEDLIQRRTKNVSTV